MQQKINTKIFIDAMNSGSNKRMKRGANRLTIKRKIWLSNILMILIPILSTAVVVIVCLHTALGSYWHTLVSIYSDENGVQFAQSMLYNYQKELWEFDWVLCQKADGSTEICPTAEMTAMGNAL